MLCSSTRPSFLCLTSTTFCLILSLTSFTFISLSIPLPPSPSLSHPFLSTSLPLSLSLRLPLSLSVSLSLWGLVAIPECLAPCHPARREQHGWRLGGQREQGQDGGADGWRSLCFRWPKTLRALRSTTASCETMSPKVRHTQLIVLLNVGNGDAGDYSDGE